MKINCLSCGHTIDFDETDSDCAWQVKCYACGALLEVKLEERLPAPAITPLTSMRLTVTVRGR